METACRFAHGVVTELLSQGQMAGLCTETYSPSRLTSYFHVCKGRYFKWDCKGYPTGNRISLSFKYDKTSQNIAI